MNLPKPDVMSWIYECRSADGQPGRASQEMLKGQRHIAEIAKSQLKWLKGSGLNVGLMYQLPHGHWTRTHVDPDNPKKLWDAMDLDAYDGCVGGGDTCDFYLKDFVSAWREVTDVYHCTAYVGTCSDSLHLKNMPTKELCELVRRNLQPIQDAGFDGVVFDTGAKTATHPMTMPSGAIVHANNMIHALNVARGMFGGRKNVGVEATPQNVTAFKAISALHETFISERDWRVRHAGPAEPTYDPNSVANGWGKDTRHLKQKIHRTYDKEPNIPKAIADIQKIFRDRCVPVVNVGMLMDAGVDPRDLIPKLDG